jgi:hypothetical protein
MTRWPSPSRRARRPALAAALVLGVALAAGGTGLIPGPATLTAAYAAAPGCSGIPPWGFHTGSFTGPRGSFSRGHGEINLDANTVSGVICQETRVPGKVTRAITMSVEHHLDYHSHQAVMWGFPGNVIKIHVRVLASSDPGCEKGSVGRATLFASYNGVRSDSVQFFFPAACKDQDHLYHGNQVNNQVPPL